MNRKIVSMLIIITFMLAGCSSAPAATATTSNSISTATRLAAGTLKLEGTTQAVTVSQAAQLLTLWEGYQSLGKSDMSSSIEMEALVKQIQGVMTSDQLQAIEKMGITDTTINELMQSMGSTLPQAAASTPGRSALSQAGPGGGPGGMPGGGGDSIMSAIGDGTTMQSTAAATQPAASTQTTQVNAMLLNTLIQMLETRSQSTG